MSKAISKICIILFVLSTFTACTNYEPAQDEPMQVQDYTDDNRVTEARGATIPAPQIEFCTRIDEQLEFIAKHFPKSIDGAPYWPDSFGGMYFEGDYVVLLIVESARKEVAELLYQLPEGIIVREVIFSLNELLAAVKVINGIIHEYFSEADVWTDTISNRVYVTFRPFNEGIIAWFRQEIIDSPMVYFQNPLRHLRISQPLRTQPFLESVKMTASRIDTEQNVVIVTIYNNTQRRLSTGYYTFALEAFDGEVWRVLPNDIPFRALGTSIAPRSYREFRKNLRHISGFEPLEPGLYRIRKEVFQGTHDIVAEFYWNVNER